jgi:hypothetical protein
MIKIIYFKGLFVPKSEEKKTLLIQMHKDLGHFKKQKTLAEICWRYFWHSRIEDVKTVVRMCQHCQMVRKVGSIRSENGKLKNIHVCELFFRVAMDTPLLPKPKQETNIC